VLLGTLRPGSSNACKLGRYVGCGLAENFRNLYWPQAGCVQHFNALGNREGLSLKFGRFEKNLDYCVEAFHYLPGFLLSVASLRHKFSSVSAYTIKRGHRIRAFR